MTPEMPPGHGEPVVRAPRAWLGRRLLDRAAQEVRIAVVVAVLLAAGSTGAVIPITRLLVEQTGHGRIATGFFMAAHVLGGVVGAGLGRRALRRAGSPRRLAVLALIASIAVTLALAGLVSLELRIALRFVDGACHLLAITALVAAATAGEPHQRVRRAVIMGVAIVLGVAGGLAIGGALGRPETALIAAAALSGAALATVLARVAAEPSPVPQHRASQRRPIAPGLLAFCERFSFGSITAAMSGLPPARIGLVLGVFMTASVLALAAAWHYGLTWGPRKLAVRSALGFTLALASCAAVDVLGSRSAAVTWAIAAGIAAGALYASALVLATRSAEIEDRASGMATVHAAGSAGHALGLLSASTLALPGMLVVAVPGIAVIAVAAIGVWLTVPEATADCPVIGGLEPGASNSAAIAAQRSSGR
ncbi:MAG: MFS transporter [Deltaproteobacteria bacterium]|nr:MAG: MFS transporter [Deltaproteobacteria bacterium]